MTSADARLPDEERDARDEEDSAPEAQEQSNIRVSRLSDCPGLDVDSEILLDPLAISKEERNR